MHFSQLQFNTDNIQGNIESASQAEPYDFSMANLNMQYMQMEGAIQVDPTSTSENQPRAGPTFSSPFESTIIPHSSYRMNGSPVNQLLSNFIAYSPMIPILSTLFYKGLFMPFAFNFEQFLLLLMLVNTSGGNWHANNPLSLNWNTESNLNIALPTQFSSDQARSLEGTTDATNCAQASTVSNPDLRRGSEAATFGAQGSRSMISVFTNGETLNQRAIANHETIPPVSNSSKSHYARRRAQRRAKRQTQYSCNVCPESFRTVKDLDEHTKAIHGKYKCQVCGVEIANRSNLLRHELKHLNQRPYVCRICSKTYFRQDHLKRHMESKHQDYDANGNMVVTNVTTVHPYALTSQILKNILL